MVFASATASKFFLCLVLFTCLLPPPPQARFTCFVVNHGYLPDMKESIEIFQLNADAGTLTHLETRVDDVNFKM